MLPRHVGLSAGPAYVPGAEMECRVHWGALVRFLRKSLDLSTMIKCLFVLRPFPLLQQKLSSLWAVSFWSHFLWKLERKSSPKPTLIFIHLDSYLNYMARHLWHGIQGSSFVSSRKERGTMFLSSVMRTGYRICKAQSKMKRQAPLSKHY